MTCRFHEFELLMKELDPGLRSHFYGKMYAETLELADEMNFIDGRNTAGLNSLDKHSGF